MDDDSPNVPVIIFNGDDEPTIAENIYNAQMAGWPRVLTYDKNKDKNLRKEVMTSELGNVPIVDGKNKHRDEYPFFCSKENNGSAFIGHVSAIENRRQGGRLSAFLKGKPDGFKFMVQAVWPPPSQRGPKT